MEGKRADVVVVGARCAGATLATFLARQGARVVVLERAALHTDHVLSTHQIHPQGVDVLDEVGVGDAVRAEAPGTSVVRLAKDDAEVDIHLPPGRVELCPRRQRLDGLLQDAASSAGAELRDHCRVTEILLEDGRARGVRCLQGDREEVIRADLVVGADGRHSTVARAVGASEYLGYDAPRDMFWSYFPTPSAWRDEEAYPFGMYVANRGGRVRTIFQTDDDRLLLGSLPTVDEAEAWRRDPLASLLEDLPRDPLLAPLVAEAGEPLERVRATRRERYFLRQAAGPGWLLVGDAGHHKDFVIGDGITEALTQARSAAGAIAERTDGALQRWWRARDVEAVPLFFMGQDEGAPGSPLELQRVVFRHAARREDLRTRMTQVFEREVEAHKAFPPSSVLRWALWAALKGRPGVLRDFATLARRGAQVSRELARRRELLAALEG